MRNENSVVYSFFFQFFHASIGIKEKKLIWVEDSTTGAKQSKESLVSFSGDDLEHELKGNVEIHASV